MVLPSTIFAEKEGTFTNLQGRVQRIRQAYPPKGQARTDLDILHALGERVAGNDEQGRRADAENLFEEIRASIPAFQSMQWNASEQSGVMPGTEAAPAES